MNRSILFAALLLVPNFLWADPQEVTGVTSHLTTPPGFQVEVYAEDLGEARGMALSPEGVLHVCDKKGGRILRITPGAPGNPAEVKILVEGLHSPHSLAFYKDQIFVGETDRIASFLITDHRLTREDGRLVLALPAGGAHGTRTILFGPDGKLYVSIGSTCNVCEESDEKRATICRLNPDGTGFEIFARGLRNAVGMAFRPETQELWASCNGRDLLGDDLPPECLYQVEQGKHYGWPYSYGMNGKAVLDPDFGSKGSRQTGFPVLEYQAHSAPLGVAFYIGGNFPKAYHAGVFMAFHGSWNRSVPVGCKVVFVPLLEGKKAGKPQDFLWGFLEGTQRFGRPVDVLEGSAGELFVSDDSGGRIFRVSYGSDPQK